MTREELALALERTNLLRSADAARGVRAGWEMVWGQSIGSRNELASIYAIRLNYLRSLETSAHATQLADSVEEFVRNLRNELAASGRWVQVTGPDEVEYSIFCSESGEVLGCMRTMSLLRVSPERWAELWGKEFDPSEAGLSEKPGAGDRE